MQSTSLSGRLFILDPLRLIAALSVVLYHYLPFISNTIAADFVAPFRYGYLGVVFFFMLSGFVIMASCQNRSAIQFAFARAIRIYPAFIICLLITVSVVWLFSDQKFSLPQILSNALLINDYVGFENIDAVYWTLQAELKFYACVFLLCFFRVIDYWRAWLSVWLLISITHYFFKQPFFMGWFISPTYSFYFIGGVSAYLLSKNVRDRFALVIFFIALIFSCIKSYSQAYGFIVGASTLDGIIASSLVCMFYAFFLGLANRKFLIGKSSYWVLMGGISYPIYLIHDNAGKSLMKFLSGYSDALIAVALTLTAVVITAIFVHVSVEKRIFRLFDSLLRRFAKA